jgi:N-acylneuraminate cytidylyltransferase/CMP-N,N'-diacetyllegionaminic acid synthase
MGSSSVNRVIVSTDDEEIASISRHWGAEVPFLRPAELAEDDSPHVPVLLHAVEWLKAHEAVTPGHVLLLQPTLPLRSSRDIDGAADLLREKDADSVVGVCEAPSHPYLTKKLGPDGRLEDFVPAPAGYLRRQSLPPAYAINGAIYLVRTDVLLRKRSFYTDRTYGYVMPPERSIDIDTPWDLYLVDLILKDRGHHGEL